MKNKTVADTTLKSLTRSARGTDPVGDGMAD